MTQLIQAIFTDPDIPKYIEKLKEQKVKDENEKRKLDRKREKEIVGRCRLIQGMTSTRVTPAERKEQRKRIKR